MSRRSDRPNPTSRLFIACLAVALGCAERGRVAGEPAPAAARQAPAAPAPSAFSSVPAAPAASSEAGERKELETLEDPIIISADGWVRPGRGNPDPPEYVLVKEVLARIRDGDEPALGKMRLSAREYSQMILAEAEPDTRNRDFYFTLNELHSTKGIGRAVSRYGQHDLELLQIIPTLGIERCSDFTMFNWIELVVFDRDKREELTLKVIGGIILRKDGAAKVANYRS